MSTLLTLLPLSKNANSVQSTVTFFAIVAHLSCPTGVQQNIKVGYWLVCTDPFTPLNPTGLTGNNKLRGSGEKTEKTTIVNKKSSYSHVHSIAHDNNSTNKHVNRVMGERKETDCEWSGWVAPSPPSFPLPLFSCVPWPKTEGLFWQTWLGKWTAGPVKIWINSARATFFNIRILITLIRKQ